MKKKKINLIKKYSLETGTEISYMAAFLGISRVYLSGVIGGSENPSEELCKKICKLIACKWKLKKGKRIFY